MRVPIGSSCLLISTAALRSKRIALPSLRRTGNAVRTITAWCTSPFFTLPRGIASLIGHHDDVAHRGGLPLRAAQHLDALHAARAGVVGDLQVGFDRIMPPLLRWSGAASASPLRSTTSQVLRLLIGRHSSMRTVSPILHRFASSCAAYFFERRMNFLYSGCMTRRSTRTVTVLSILSLVTRPVRTRFGIRAGLLTTSPRSEFAARALLAMMVFTRAISRRTCRTRPTPSCWPVARWKRRLNCSLRRSSSIVLSSSGVFARTSVALPSPSRVSDARDELRLIGSLAAPSVSASRARSGRHAVDLEHDPARRHAAHPELRASPCRNPCAPRPACAETGTSGKMRIQTRPVRFIARVMARRAASICRAVSRSGSIAFRPIGAEVQRRAALGVAMDAALVRLAVLGALRLQHLFLVYLMRIHSHASAAPVRRRARSCAIGSCAMISPLNTHTFTPQVP